MINLFFKIAFYFFFNRYAKKIETILLHYVFKLQLNVFLLLSHLNIHNISCYWLFSNYLQLDNFVKTKFFIQICDQYYIEYDVIIRKYTEVAIIKATFIV